MGDFAASFSLSGVDGANGFRIDGPSVGRLGRAVGSAGDINGDGFADLVVSKYGGTFVLFGTATPFASVVTVSALNGANGFSIPDFVAADSSGASVAGGFDFNGDGLQDLLIGAPHSDINAGNSGAAYIIYGRQGGFPATITSAYLDGIGGTTIYGKDGGDWLGWAVSSAGDVNGDGRDDIFLAARFAESGGFDTGAAYVIFGQPGGLATSLNVSSLNGTNGFKIGRAAPGPYSQFTASAIGDINGDGYDDVAIGQPYATSSSATEPGSVYVVFGKASGFAAEVNVLNLNGADGFEIVGKRARDWAGQTVSRAGDVNGDGIEDILVGAPEADVAAGNTGAAYVVFGKATGFTAKFNLSTLNGTNGFQISGGTASDRLGLSLSAIGDINGDGIGDVGVTAPAADPDGIATGAAYVVFGKTTPFTSIVQLSSLNGVNGFRITGAAIGDLTAAQVGADGSQIGAAGDINGDGIDDLIVAAGRADFSGPNFGSVYVIYGHRIAETFVGGAGDETANGSSMVDSLSGGGGQDIHNGLAGDDLLDGGDNSDLLNGGDGADDLLGGAGGDVLNGDAGDDSLDGGVGADKLNGGTGDDILVGGLGNDRLAGGDDNDSLTGGDGNDTLDGGAGTDTLNGGLGNDIYILAAGDIDTVVEAANGGYDIIRADREVTMAANVEAVELQGTGDHGVIGNAISNHIQGNSGANRLNGGAGVDTLNGADGDDIIIGGEGNDLLRGGTGRDIFAVLQESIARPALETDQVYDFQTAEGDRIDLSQIDAIAGAADDAFTYVGTTFSKHAGEMTLTFAAGITTMRLDVNGDGKTDYQMKVNGDVTGDSAGWAL